MKLGPILNEWKFKLFFCFIETVSPIILIIDQSFLSLINIATITCSSPTCCFLVLLLINVQQEYLSRVFFSPVSRLQAVGAERRSSGKRSWTSFCSSVFLLLYFFRLVVWRETNSYLLNSNCDCEIESGQTITNYTAEQFMRVSMIITFIYQRDTFILQSECWCLQTELRAETFTDRQ